MHWYEEDVAAAVSKRINCPYPPESIFYGSSTITLWATLYDDFKDFKPVNLGFGGSTLSACIQFFDRIVAPVKNPQRFILYAGDNDLGDGNDPHSVCNLYVKFRALLRRHYSDIPFYFISVKPSINRFEIIDKIRTINQLVKEQVKLSDGNDYFINIYPMMLDAKGHPQKNYFESDGLHLNDEGYEVLKEAVMNELIMTEQLT